MDGEPGDPETYEEDEYDYADRMRKAAQEDSLWD